MSLVPADRARVLAAYLLLTALVTLGPGAGAAAAAAAPRAPGARVAPAGGAGESGVELRLGREVHRLARAVARDGRRFFSAPEAMRALKLRYAWEPATGRLAFGSGKRAGIVWAGLAGVTVSGHRVELSAPPFVQANELMVPADFAERALAAVVGRQITLGFIGPVPLAPEQGLSLVVLDPGHGGRDAGAVGPGGTMEKDLTLAIARRVRAHLQKAGDLEVLLTRDEDVFVPLQARVAMANARRADLFVSIHLNAAPSRSATGTETYFLSAVASDESARASAEFENRSLELEEKPAAAAPPDLAFILGDLARSASIRESETFAARLQDRFGLDAPSVRGVNRGVKQAPFVVLMGADMPAVLTEVGFISNPDQERALRTPAAQEEIARAVARSILDYKAQVDGAMGVRTRRVAAPGAGDQR
jgi:N-acetylmuramoyl-L-alanine amidase